MKMKLAMLGVGRFVAKLLEKSLPAQREDKVLFSVVLCHELGILKEKQTNERERSGECQIGIDLISQVNKILLV